jgi:hypothetical protein
MASRVPRLTARGRYAVGDVATARAKCCRSAAALPKPASAAARDLAYPRPADGVHLGAGAARVASSVAE